ncbi:MAG: hypothetical protein ABI806_20710 [Candidatus Solibacter sp.]
MIFSLEALQAGTGDCLILHYGNTAKPKFIVIDGGPPTIYDGSLKPRLQAIHDKFIQDASDKLPLEMVMVSHIDDDHIHGILDWMEDIASDGAVPCNIATLWYNSFDDILKKTPGGLKTRVASLADDLAAGAAPDGLSEPMAKVLVASVGQGRELRAQAEARGIVLNGGFKESGGGPGLVMAPAKGDTAITRPGGLKLHVIGPGQKQLSDLEDSWIKDVQAHPDAVVVANFVDRSVPNLSSIVVVAEFQGKRILLTGDARGDFVRNGLETAGFLDQDGKAHFDVIKMPHHGSSRNMRLDWLQNLTADHYVISANGQFSNPDKETIEWLCQARGDDKYTLHLTNEKMLDPKTGADVGAEVKAALHENPGAHRVVDFRKPAAASVIANLLDPVTY